MLSEGCLHDPVLVMLVLAAMHVMANITSRRERPALVSMPLAKSREGLDCVASLLGGLTDRLLTD